VDVALYDLFLFVLKVIYEEFPFFVDVWLELVLRYHGEVVVDGVSLSEVVLALPEYKPFGECMANSRVVYY
jgi:hypothetical protein